MSDLIRRDDAIESFSEICVTDDLLGMGVKKGLVIAEMRIKDMPAVDAVEVVRCFRCRYWEPSDNGRWMTKSRTDGVCRMLLDIHCSARYMTGKDHFCSYGERREENAVD